MGDGPDGGETASKNRAASSRPAVFKGHGWHRQPHVVGQPLQNGFEIAGLPGDGEPVDQGAARPLSLGSEVVRPVRRRAASPEAPRADVRVYLTRTPQLCRASWLLQPCGTPARHATRAPCPLQRREDLQRRDEPERDGLTRLDPASGPGAASTMPSRRTSGYGCSQRISPSRVGRGPPRLVASESSPEDDGSMIGVH